MFIHTVFFWFKEGVKEQDITIFEEGLVSLLNISTVQTGYWGKPANTPRDVVDNSYAYGLTALFEDREKHDAYQEDEQHLKFIEQCAAMWENVKVYDYLTE
jgi:hypothetical protein